jgi:hypothetical protein
VGRISLAFRAFFAVLASSATGQRVAAALAGETTAAALPAPAAPAKSAAPPAAKPSRSDAITLLATLQREARLVDFLMEPIDQYSDQQIGAAARDVHRQSAAVVQRLFDLAPLTTEAPRSTYRPAARPTSIT